MFGIFHPLSTVALAQMILTYRLVLEPSPQTSYVNGIFAYFRSAAADLTSRLKLTRFGNLEDLLSHGFCGCVRMLLSTSRPDLSFSWCAIIEL